MIGLFLYPRAVFAAFRKGSAVGRNLYHGVVYDDALLGMTVGELRRRHGVTLAASGEPEEKSQI